MPTKEEVVRLLEAFARQPKASGPVTLPSAYLRAVERWEALPENGEGEPKAWVLRADRSFQATVAQARLLLP